MDSLKCIIDSLKCITDSLKCIIDNRQFEVYNRQFEVYNRQFKVSKLNNEKNSNVALIRLRIIQIINDSIFYVSDLINSRFLEFGTKNLIS